MFVSANEHWGYYVTSSYILLLFTLAIGIFICIVYHSCNTAGASIWSENLVCRGSCFENWGVMGPENLTDGGT